MPNENADGPPKVAVTEMGLVVSGGMVFNPEGIGEQSEAIQQDSEMVGNGRPKRRASEGVAAAVGAVKAREPKVWEWFSNQGPTAAQRHAKSVEESKKRKQKEAIKKRFKAPREESKAALELVVPSLRQKYRNVRKEAVEPAIATATCTEGSCHVPQRHSTGSSST